jgi:hypothetical protein
MVRGRPARVGREILACPRAIRSRCRRSTVSGRTSSRRLRRTSRGSWCSRAASHARSAGGEPDLLAVRSPFEDGDLVPERQDLGVFVPVAHREQPQQHERVGHTEVGQSKQHNGSFSRSAQRRSPPPQSRGARDGIGGPVSVIKVAMSRPDEVFGTRKVRTRSPQRSRCGWAMRQLPREIASAACRRPSYASVCLAWQTVTRLPATFPTDVQGTRRVHPTSGFEGVAIIFASG